MSATRRSENYLLNLCLAFDWEHVDEHCELLVKTFKSSSQSQSQPFLAGRKQLLATDEYGNTPLHAACHHKPPASTINAILKAASMTPGGAVQILAMKNSSNATPLSIASVTGASAEVLHELLYPPTGLVGSGSVVTEADSQGMTPILGVMLRSEVFPHIPLIVDNQQTDKCESDCTNDTDDCSSTTQSSGDDIISNFQEKLSTESLMTLDALIRAAWWSTEQTSNCISTIHGAANIAECIPPNLTDVLLHKYEDSVLTADDDGTLPLHLAVTSNPVSHQQSQKDTDIHHQFLYNRKYLIDRLLQVNPLSASQPVPNHEGRSLFCQAVDSGLHWHIKTDKKTEDENLSVNGPLQSLWECTPDALYTKDPETNLYPFQLAATVESPSSDDVENSIDDTLQVNTIFNLLKEYPQALKNACEEN